MDSVQEVKSLTSFFTVPKGEGDVWMVYDGTKSGLNADMWAPWFALPTIESHLRCVSPGYYMGDLDFSEQFLNFMMHVDVQCLAGVDLTLYFPDEVNPVTRVLHEHWCRCGMGFFVIPIQFGAGNIICSGINSWGPFGSEKCILMG